jgi:hypothetical protein
MRSLRQNRESHHYFLISLTPITFDFSKLPCYGGSYYETIAVFHTSQRPLNLLGHQCIGVIDTSYNLPLLASEPVHHSELSYVVSNRPRGRCSDLHHHTSSVNNHTFWFHDTSMGHARLVCTEILLFPRERFGSHSFPSPSGGSFLKFLSSLFLTMALSAKETLMYFDHTYDPNLTHQGAFVITEKSFAALHTMVEERHQCQQQLVHL